MQARKWVSQGSYEPPRLDKKYSKTMHFLTIVMHFCLIFVKFLQSEPPLQARSQGGGSMSNPGEPGKMRK